MNNLLEIASKLAGAMAVAFVLCSRPSVAAETNPYHWLKLSGPQSAVAVQAVSQQLAGGTDLTAIRKSELVITPQGGGYRAEFSPTDNGGIRSAYSILGTNSPAQQTVSINGDFAAALFLASKAFRATSQSQDLKALQFVGIMYGTQGPQWVGVGFMPQIATPPPPKGFITLGCDPGPSFAVNLQTEKVYPVKPIC